MFCILIIMIGIMCQAHALSLNICVFRKFKGSNQKIILPKDRSGCTSLYDNLDTYII
jgi:hypothetical protein